MFVDSVVKFCAVIATDKELQTKIKSALTAQQGVECFCSQAQERGFAATEDEVLQTFAAERERREQLEDDQYGETRIQRNEDADVSPGVAGLRTVALSGDWQIGRGQFQSDNVLD